MLKGFQAGLLRDELYQTYNSLLKCTILEKTDDPVFPITGCHVTKFC